MKRVGAGRQPGSIELNSIRARRGRRGGYKLKLRIIQNILLVRDGGALLLLPLLLYGHTILAGLVGYDTSKRNSFAVHSYS